MILKNRKGIRAQLAGIGRKRKFIKEHQEESEIHAGGLSLLGLKGNTLPPTE